MVMHERVSSHRFRRGDRRLDVIILVRKFGVHFSHSSYSMVLFVSLQMVMHERVSSLRFRRGDRRLNVIMLRRNAT